MNDRLPRKLAAILYADVAGYSRLTGDDEDATHRSLSEYLNLISQTIESHRGQVMHYAGDAVLAKFEAVVDSVSSATDIQRLLADRNEDLADEQRTCCQHDASTSDCSDEWVWSEPVTERHRHEEWSDQPTDHRSEHRQDHRRNGDATSPGPEFPAFSSHRHFCERREDPRDEVVAECQRCPCDQKGGIGDRELGRRGPKP